MNNFKICGGVDTKNSGIDIDLNKIPFVPTRVFMRKFFFLYSGKISARVSVIETRGCLTLKKFTRILTSLYENIYMI